MMKRHAFCFLFAVGAAAVLASRAGIVSAQAPPVGTVVRLDPALDQIISSTEKVQMLKEDYFGLSEGPVWCLRAPPGRDISSFTGIGANVIYKWTSDNKMSVFLDKSGFTGNIAEAGRGGYVANTGRLWIVNFGSNGIALDGQGRIVFTAQGDRAIVRIEKDGMPDRARRQVR